MFSRECGLKSTDIQGLFTSSTSVHLLQSKGQIIHFATSTIKEENPVLGGPFEF